MTQILVAIAFEILLIIICSELLREGPSRKKKTKKYRKSSRKRSY